MLSPPNIIPFQSMCCLREANNFIAQYCFKWFHGHVDFYWSTKCMLVALKDRGTEFQVSSLANVPYQLRKQFYVGIQWYFFLTCTVFSYPYFIFFLVIFIVSLQKSTKKMNLKLKTPVLLLLFRRNVSVHFRKSSKQVLNEVILVKTSNSIKLTWPG